MHGSIVTENVPGFIKKTYKRKGPTGLETVSPFSHIPLPTLHS